MLVASVRFVFVSFFYLHLTNYIYLYLFIFLTHLTGPPFLLKLSREKARYDCNNADLTAKSSVQ